MTPQQALAKFKEENPLVSIHPDVERHITTYLTKKFDRDGSVSDDDVFDFIMFMEGIIEILQNKEQS